MKLLLTSAGIKNTSIHDALVDLLGKPIAESSALCIPTAIYPFPGGPVNGLSLHQRSDRQPLVRIGVEVVGRAGTHRAPQHQSRVLDRCGPGDGCPAGVWRRCPVSVPLDAGVRVGGPPAVAARDGLCGGERRQYGDGPYFRRDVRRPDRRPSSSRTGLGLVDFALLPHLDHEDHPESSTAKVERMAAEVPVPTYGIDDQTAIKVTVDGTVEVVSEGHWKLFTP